MKGFVPGVIAFLFAAFVVGAPIGGLLGTLAIGCVIAGCAALVVSAPFAGRLLSVGIGLAVASTLASGVSGQAGGIVSALAHEPAAVAGALVVALALIAVALGRLRASKAKPSARPKLLARSRTLFLDPVDAPVRPKEQRGESDEVGLFGGGGHE